MEVHYNGEPSLRIQRQNLRFPTPEHWFALQLDAQTKLVFLEVAVLLVAQVAVADETVESKACELIEVWCAVLTVVLLRVACIQNECAARLAGPFGPVVVVAMQKDAEIFRFALHLHRQLNRPLQTSTPENVAVTLVLVLEELAHIGQFELEQGFRTCDVSVLDLLFQFDVHVAHFVLENVDLLSLILDDVVQTVEAFVQICEKECV